MPHVGVSHEEALLFNMCPYCVNLIALNPKPLNFISWCFCLSITVPEFQFLHINADNYTLDGGNLAPLQISLVFRVSG